MIAALAFLLPFFELIYHHRTKATGFVRISDTEPKENICTLYGAVNSNGSFLLALFNEHLLKESMEIHAKIYSSKDEAFNNAQKEFFPRFCELGDGGSLTDELEKIFEKEDLSKTGQQLHALSNQFSHHLLAKNKLQNAYNNFEDIAKTANGTRIILHLWPYWQMYEFVNEYLNPVLNYKTTLQEFIKSIITMSQPIVEVPHSVKPSLDGLDSKALESFYFYRSFAVSSPVRFINDCSLDNSGVKDVSKKIISDGFVTSIYGPIFSQSSFTVDMEFHFITETSTDPL